jgi:hypothetical protein
MSDYVKAWQCIGCGKIEAPQTCVGVCQNRKVEFVYAFEHEAALARLEVARWRPSVARPERVQGGGRGCADGSRACQPAPACRSTLGYADRHRADMESREARRC